MPSPEQIDAIVRGIKELGFPVMVGIVALFIVIKVINSYFKREDSTVDLNESTHTELFELRKQVDKAIGERILLEKDFAACDKERQRLTDYISLLENKQQNAVENYLDDTKNFGQELDMKDREILKLTGEITKRDAIILQRDELIAKFINEKYGSE